MYYFRGIEAQKGLGWLSNQTFGESLPGIPYDRTSSPNQVLQRYHGVGILSEKSLPTVVEMPIRLQHTGCDFVAPDANRNTCKYVLYALHVSFRCFCLLTDYSDCLRSETS
ncbi:hypothetical protein EVAR_69215_1 [Eumeta japonica]|uniref:Uncharacterized protein n=1 Tax=Eumeta variegata TaxID=151549 RepID=A0A4C2AH94_EUMVA|nr:hypothetical protein EVAR_69215_1 [Eumeta japonica]